MKIAIDIDNTICDTTNFFKELSIRYDREVLHKNNDIDFSKVVPRTTNWTNEELDYYIKNIFNKEAINIPIKRDVSYYIQELKNKGYYIIFITNRGIKDDDYTDRIVEEFLKKNDIPYDEIITKAKNKYQYLTNVDYFIDDSIEECEKMLSNSNCKIIIMESPQNINYTNAKLYKVKNWKEVFDYIT